jgi:hypothetical protein
MINEAFTLSILVRIFSSLPNDEDALHGCTSVVVSVQLSS